eukprot:1187164-Prorocentrum_minimum.AAC.1
MVDVLRTGSPADKTSAADVLANLSANSKYELAVMTAGAVGPLVDLLRSGSSAGKEGMTQSSHQKKGTPAGVVNRAQGPALGSWEDRPPAAYSVFSG